MSQYFETTANVLLYFLDDSFTEGIESLKWALSNSNSLRVEFETTKKAVQRRLFDEGEPLSLIHYKANQVLDENTDEEAYKWLQLMIDNIERDDGQFIEY